MVRPGSALRVKLGIDKARNKVCHRIIIRDISGFDIVVIKRDHDVARITHDVDDVAIEGLKTFVALQDPWARQAAHDTVGIEVNLWNARFNIGESDWLVLVDQIAEPGRRHQEIPSNCVRPIAARSARDQLARLRAKRAVSLLLSSA